MANVLEVRLVAAFNHLDHIGEKRRERLHFERISRKLDGVAPDGDAGAEGILNGMKQLVGLSDDAGHAHVIGGG